jgi:hypothetical protein
MPSAPSDVVLLPLSLRHISCIRNSAHFRDLYSTHAILPSLFPATANRNAMPPSASSSAAWWRPDSVATVVPELGGCYYQGDYCGQLVWYLAKTRSCWLASIISKRKDRALSYTPITIAYGPEPRHRPWEESDEEDEE